MSAAVTDEIYQQVILDHNRTPHNFRTMDDATHVAEGLNPLCGDAYTVYLVLDAEGRIQDITFHGAGCAISKASASMMTVTLKGRTMGEAETLFKTFHALVTGDPLDDARLGTLGKLRVFAGVWHYPSRVKCAALPWHALHSALKGEKTVTTEDKL
ncbi:MAG: SUF system NifU family Fe-S cluster assembly protein [Verrucomicrobia bacterium]|nr:SUF system NifU family Fe-S cluster assembly protein [Verrucomicrobiota bacterium]